MPVAAPAEQYEAISIDRASPEPLKTALDPSLAEHNGRYGPRPQRTPELAERICELISEGHTLKRIISGDFGFTFSWGFVCDWLKADDSFNKSYAQARQRMADLLVDEILEYAAKTTQENAQAMRVKIDTNKWVASKVLPKVYGDKPADINIHNTTNVLVCNEEQRAEMIRLRKELSSEPQPQLLDANITDKGSPNL